MSSTGSNSTEPETPGQACGPPRGSVALAVAALALLVVLVWALSPDRPNFKPAPLHPVSADCPRSQQEFIPSNVTELPDPPLDALSPQEKNRALLRMNLEPCTCGCGLSVALCRVKHPACQTSREVAREIIAEVQAESRK